ncbi:hypothetical protein DPMN_155954 [Dreissena polymorpha]|uniref:Uncharacterized protein n=1 Tax=Dreissena polymorpha TaxID=45954 RepID=A0A9D4J741_DREPO|nr:hypothetical protein DPMN_155954 [Dreissena polymorpha]
MTKISSFERQLADSDIVCMDGNITTKAIQTICGICRVNGVLGKTICDICSVNRVPGKTICDIYRVNEVPG